MSLFCPWSSVDFGMVGEGSANSGSFVGTNTGGASLGTKVWTPAASAGEGECQSFPSRREGMVISSQVGTRSTKRRRITGESRDAPSRGVGRMGIEAIKQLGKLRGE